MIKRYLKLFAIGVAMVFAFPWALIAGFGRFGEMFSLAAQACATVPGLPGDYLRIAFYKLTLEQCSSAMLGKAVYIGSYCVVGNCKIGDRTQIASHVQILSGRRQHPRDASGQIGAASVGEFQMIDIGADCWIGASAIVMAPVGARSTIGAGTVVVRPVEGGVIAVGNPARVINAPSAVSVK